MAPSPTVATPKAIFPILVALAALIASFFKLILLLKSAEDSPGLNPLALLISSIVLYLLGPFSVVFFKSEYGFFVFINCLSKDAAVIEDPFVPFFVASFKPFKYF